MNDNADGFTQEPIASEFKSFPTYKSLIKLGAIRMVSFFVVFLAILRLLSKDDKPFSHSVIWSFSTSLVFVGLYLVLIIKLRVKTDNTTVYIPRRKISGEILPELTIPKSECRGISRTFEHGFTISSFLKAKTPYSLQCENPPVPVKLVFLSRRDAIELARELGITFTDS